MSKPIPKIQKFMSTCPQTILPSETVSQAHTLMRQHDIRHLPVVVDGRLRGIITDRDVKLIESVRGADPTQVRIDDVMTTHVYTVSPDALLDEVAGEMAAHKYGSAVVVQNGQVVGIFTMVDACSALRDLLHSRLEK
jgi:acetoin utilization protein AcuB